jgi:outer membrane protein OmpA-like peptidoglycan-associated protein
MLSRDRANAVVELLTVNKVEKPIKPVFYGDALSIADNNTPEGRRRNRRVEIIIEF